MNENRTTSLVWQVYDRGSRCISSPRYAFLLPFLMSTNICYLSRWYMAAFLTPHRPPTRVFVYLCTTSSSANRWTYSHLSLNNGQVLYKGPQNTLATRKTKSDRKGRNAWGTREGMCEGMRSALYLWRCVTVRLAHPGIVMDDGLFANVVYWSFTVFCQINAQFCTLGAASMSKLIATDTWYDYCAAVRTGNRERACYCRGRRSSDACVWW